MAKAYISHELSRDEQLKLIADRLYTDAENWIRYAMRNDSTLSEMRQYVNEKTIRDASGNWQPYGAVVSLPWR